MKPKNWNKLDEKRKKEIAKVLLNNVRGIYIISQALYKAIEQMKKVPISDREVSNIEDMEILQEIFFPIYKEVEEAKDKASQIGTSEVVRK